MARLGQQHLNQLILTYEGGRTQICMFSCDTKESFLIKYYCQRLNLMLIKPLDLTVIYKNAGKKKDLMILQKPTSKSRTW